MFENCDIQLETDFIQNRETMLTKEKRIIYSGTIDEYFDYTYGELEYRGLRFETESLPVDNYQGVAVVNYTDINLPYTRIIEHKHFEFGNQPFTIISKEYPMTWKIGMEPYYLINDENNNQKYNKYYELSKRKKFFWW